MSLLLIQRQFLAKLNKTDELPAPLVIKKNKEGRQYLNKWMRKQFDKSIGILR